MKCLKQPAFLVFWFMSLLVFTGCPPDFQDNACTTDADCFEDQTCQAGTCRNQAPQVPAISAFSGDKSAVTPGTEVTLTWATTNAASGRITKGNETTYTIPGADLAMGSTTVTVNETSEFTLSISNGALTADSTFKVEVQDVDAPTVQTFEANPTTVMPNAMTTLSWSTQNATAGRIEYGDQTINIEAASLESGSTMVAVAETTTFKLTIENVAGMASEEVTVNVMGEAPTITAFETDKAMIDEGDSATLSWTVGNADSITIADGDGNMIDVSNKNVDQDNVSVSPTADASYTLTATNAFGMRQQTVNIIVNQKLAIASFVANPTQIRQGDPVELSWEIRGAPTSVVIRDDQNNTVDTSNLGDITMAKVSVNPATDTTYTLTTTDGTDTVMATATVTLLPDAPAIADFVANPIEVQTGSTTTLSWQITGATALTLEDDQNNMIDISNKDLNNDTVDVTVNNNTTYTLTATNAGGMDTRTVTVLTGDVVAINSFGASATDINQGDMVTLSWDIANATAIRITDATGAQVNIMGKMLTMDSVTLSPASTSTYTLIADGFGGPAAQAVTVNVMGTPLGITSFDGTPNPVEAGNPVTLSWVATSATGVTLNATTASGTTAVDVMGKDPNNDSIMVTPTEDTTYTLSVTDGNTTLTSDVVIDTYVAASITSFDANPTSVPQNGMVTLSWQAAGATGGTLTATTTAGTSPVDLMGKDLNTDNITVAVTEDTTFTYTVTGEQNTMATQTASVTVTPAVQITSFTANPTSVLSGGMATLSWTVLNGTSITLEATDGGGTTSVDVSNSNVGGDSVTVTLTQDTTYTLTATDGVNNTTATAAVTISGLAINSFTGTPSPVARNGMLTLTWTASNATSATLTETIGANTNAIDITTKMVAGDSVVVTPSDDATYTFTVSDGANMVSDTFSVTVFDPVSITSFTADKNTTVSGEAVTLSWNVTGATSLALVDDQNNTIDISALSVTQDSITLRPQTDVVYTLTANGQQMTTDTRDASVTVGAADLMISELFVNPAGTDNGKEWVEIYNAGDTFVDLSNYSIGNGGTDWTYSTLNLSGTIPPKGCVVVGGPTSDATNFDPVFDQAVDFNPDFQNGGSSSDGVALFFTDAITNTDVPIDAILYSSPNTNGLIGENGMAKTDLSPTPGSGQSLERTSASSDIFQNQASPSPGRCFGATQLNQTRSPNDAAGQITFNAYNLDLNIMEVSLNGVVLQNCTSTGPELYRCDVPTTMATGAVDFRISQTQEYVLVNDALVTQPLNPTIDQVLAGAFFFEGRLDDPGNDFYCGISNAANVTTTVNTPVGVTLEIYVAGSTESGGDVPMGWIVESASFAPNTIPYNVFGGLTWNAAAKSTNAGNNVIYETTYDSATAQQVEVGYRISPDGGTNYYYCDRSGANLGSENGWNVGGGLLVEWTP